MASYIYQGSSRTIQVLSPTQVVDVERIDAVTTPSGVPFWRYVPVPAFLAEGSGPWLEPLASAIEQRLASGLADAASMIEDTDANGLIQDLVRFTVSVPPGPGKLGPFTTTVDVPVQLLTLDLSLQGAIGASGTGETVASLFEDALAALHAIAD
jgi:hypothetical protein